MNKRLIVGIIIIMSLTAIGTNAEQLQLAAATQSEVINHRRAPIALSGENIYIVWQTNSSGNDEVTFRASTDGGTTFTDKINLSNTTGAESQDVEIAADGDNVIVTWWERNQTAEEPVVRISTDNGETFGSLLRLGTNGTTGGQSE